MCYYDYYYYCYYCYDFCYYCYYYHHYYYYYHHHYYYCYYHYYYASRKSLLLPGATIYLLVDVPDDTEILAVRRLIAKSRNRPSWQ